MKDVRRPNIESLLYMGLMKNSFSSRTGIQIMLVFFILSGVFLLSYKFLAGAGATQSFNMWQASYNTSCSHIYGTAYDSVNKVIYAAGGDISVISGVIYRCDLTTGCNESSDWTVSNIADNGTEYFITIAYDSENQALYAGSAISAFLSQSKIYRCPTSSGCDSSSDWSEIYTSSEENLYNLTFDSFNEVMYVGTDPNGQILRCAASSGCDESSDWTISTSTNQTIIRSLTFDSANNILYAGSGSSGVIYRCDTTTGCDNDVDDWTISTTTIENGIWSLAFDSTNNILYAGSGDDNNGVGGSGIVYKCNTTTSCDNDVADWSVSFDSDYTRISALIYNSITSQIYAGAYNGGIIYKCTAIAGGCGSSNWSWSYDPDETELYGGTVDDYGFVYFGSGTSGIIYKNGFQPDLQVKLENDASYTGDDVYNINSTV